MIENIQNEQINTRDTGFTKRGLSSDKPMTFSGWRWTKVWSSSTFELASAKKKMVQLLGGDR